ncbi:MAG TPA: two-component system response regulator [Bacteroidales bacterium]|nr:MAG: hypothetical protein A2X11_10440 [Bacteroidetes bacterium GWE2_42_24]OFY32620.1 MAG: hypothetical protein A2X09_02500 [Bacteroidetes bacterium GWF2_43_11]PKP26795.1 MAG: two-component system response regulator [Bacteroidetes bacterium HGW-Bacteroidetes-22]HAQ65210.1 two-component system response regulator [Bacteroidales bacterium]HBZ65548.1 two-component system response regulator [Bacteroidales bacterium]
MVSNQKPVQFNWSDKIVLIAEDDSMSRRLLELYLAPTRVKILWATNGAEALELVRRNRKTNLALLDIQMPVMNGFEVAREIKRDYNHISIIIQTAFAVPEYQKTCREIGCEDYITKPYSMGKLLNAMQVQFSDVEVMN